MPQVKPELETFAKIKVIGVGGSGGSAVNRMMENKIRGIDFVAINTDVQALHHSLAPHKLHIGKTVTRGLGAGMDPEIGRKAAEESQNEIRDILKDTDMVFITCGLGGGTGSGAGPVVAEVARELGALTVAIVTKPFSFEGPKRAEIAERAWEELVKSVDTIITIPNDRIMQVIDKKTTMLDAFRIADEVLRHGVQGISELITIPGLINVDFADVKTIMKDTGSALMGIGTGTGDNRAVEAANAAISSPLLELSIDGAHGILFAIAGGQDLTMEEVSEAAKVITSSAASDAKIIFGAIIDETLAGSIRVTVVATGFDERHSVPQHHMDVETVAQNLFSGGSKMSPGSFARKIQKEEADEEKKFKQIIQQKNPTPSASNFFSARPVDGGSIFGNNNRNTRQPAPSNQFDQTNNNTKISSDKEDSDDDLEIPTFLRKKMGI